MRPHLVRWHKQFSDKGLVVIEVEDGRINSLTEVQEHAEQNDLPYVIIHDGNGEIVSRYGVMAYPTAYVVDRTGKVIWEGHPGATQAEAAIRRALGQGNGTGTKAEHA